MSRISVATLERQLEFARKRELYLKRTDLPVKSTVDPRPKTQVGYRSSQIVIASASVLYTIQASLPSLVFFGNQAALGLIANTGTLLADAQPAPRALKPAMLRATVGDATPNVRTAKGSGRRYINYAANAAGNAQAHFSAPISRNEPLVTPEEQQDAARVRATAINASLGGEYGRVSFVPERFTQSLR